MKSEKELDEVRKLRAELRQSKAAMADLYLEFQIEKQMLSIILEETGRNREDLKKT